MRKLIKDVAEVVADFQTLGLLEKKNVKSLITKESITQKRILMVQVVGKKENLKLCLEMLENLADTGHGVSIHTIPTSSANRCMFVAKFYEK